MTKKMLLIFLLIVLYHTGYTQFLKHNEHSNHGNKFEQLGTILRSPNNYRTASGAPGPQYWQQKADYDIQVEIDDNTQTLTGSEIVTYTNNSPDVLTYLWLQLDENQHKADGENKKFSESKILKKMSAKQIQKIIGGPEGHGINILKVADVSGNKLSYTINETLMRVELPKPLLPGAKFSFKIDWNYKIINRIEYGGRGGYEYFPEDNNYLYTITQWYPRLAVYSDFGGWQNKQFTGVNEFSQCFGDFNVRITVPSDHIVGATGECSNYQKVLNTTQYERWKEAQNSNEPIKIVTLDEAERAIKDKSTTKKTWIYNAKNVRDFAFTSSRRFIWDAMAVKLDDKKPMAMSYYCKEAYPIYSRYSTKAIAKTLEVYSRHTIDYPYPVAISVEAANGMEYPMICFNHGRADSDGSYSAETKYGAISVIIHEIGHNFFPMIVNSDERQWAWMDEGLNSFLQYLTEQEWEENYPSKRGPTQYITEYMAQPKDLLEPIMTNYDNIVNTRFGAYAKTATGLNILRETIMGHELFDYSFKEYAKRWAFKHPTPDDFFRTMEDASAVDLDWFWRGWFYSTDPVDISIDDVRRFRLDSKNPVIEEKINKVSSSKSQIKRDYYIDKDTSLSDFYNKLDRSVLTKKQENELQAYYNSLSNTEKEIYNSKMFFYEIDFSNKGGMVMPLIIEWNFKDGSKEVERIPAYIWRKNENKITKAFAKPKEVVSINLDPYLETADTNISNNSFNVRNGYSTFELLKQKPAAVRGESSGDNPMKKSLKAVQ